MDWLLKRLREPTTYAGLAGVAVGVGELGKINEAPAVADALVNAGSVAVAGASWPVVAVTLVGGLLSILLKEKGGR